MENVFLNRFLGNFKNVDVEFPVCISIAEKDEWQIDG